MPTDKELQEELEILNCDGITTSCTAKFVYLFTRQKQQSSEINTLFGKMDTANNKLSEMNGTLNQMATKHEKDFGELKLIMEQMANRNQEKSSNSILKIVMWIAAILISLLQGAAFIMLAQVMQKALASH